MAIIADAVFVLMWLVAQELVAQISTILTISENDRWMVDAFSVVFALSTLFAVVIIVLRDLAIILIRAIKDIRSETSSRRTQEDLSQQRETGQSVSRLRDTNDNDSDLHRVDTERLTGAAKKATNA